MTLDHRVPAETITSRPQLPAQLLETVRVYQRADIPEATIRAYKTDALLFDEWCRKQGLPGFIPAPPEAVDGFLAAEAGRGVKASTSTAAWPRSATRTSSSASWIRLRPVRSAFRCSRRTIGAARRQKAPATAENVGAMLSHGVVREPPLQPSNSTCARRAR
jgi:hypothetical protein